MGLWVADGEKGLIREADGAFARIGPPATPPRGRCCIPPLPGLIPGICAPADGCFPAG